MKAGTCTCTSSPTVEAGLNIPVRQEKSLDDAFAPPPDKVQKQGHRFISRENSRPYLPRPSSFADLTDLNHSTGSAHCLQADPLTGQDVRKNRILLLYTGGAQGWKKVQGGQCMEIDLTV